MEDNKPNKPYHGAWVVCLIMAATPALLFFLFRSVIVRYENISPEMNRAEALFLSGLIGVLFDLLFFFSGGLARPWAVVRERMASFFSNLFISFRAACKWHREDVREGGIVFWLYLSFFLAAVGEMLWGLFSFLQLRGLI